MITERLTTFMEGWPLLEVERQYLWALLAEAMRLHHLRLVSQPSVVEMVKPLTSSFMLTPSATEQLQRYLKGRRSCFPFGTIEVNEDGRVTSLTITTPVAT